MEVRHRTDENARRIVGVSGHKRVGGGKVGVPAMPTGKAAHLPAADNLVEPARRGGDQTPSPAKRQVIDKVAAEIVGHIKVGVAATFPRPHHVTDKPIASNGWSIGYHGDVIDRV